MQTTPIATQNAAVSRRTFLSATAAAVALPWLPGRALAFSSQTHGLTVGATELTVVSDGHLVLPVSILAPATPPEDMEALLKQAFGTPPETVMPECNNVLLKAGNDLILVDSGSGANFQPTAGKLLAHLAANGIDPGSVTKVVFTHAHPDHVWGTMTADGGLAFPNATYYVDGTEYDFWTDPATLAAFPEDFKPFVTGAADNLKATEPRLVRVKDGDSIAPGISVVTAPGHTPGHIGVLVDGGYGLLITGDAFATPWHSVAHPDWVFGFDSIPEQAIATRKTLLDRIAADRLQILAYHFPWPGVGRIERKDGGYRFVAAG